MVGGMTGDGFVDEALRLGQEVVAGALISRGHATWLADGFIWADGSWRRRVATLGPGLLDGSAGVGWFLARLAALTGDPESAQVATSALRHSLKRAESLTDAGRLGWYAGSCGIAWAAIEAGRILRRDELISEGFDAAQACLAGAYHGPADLTLLNGRSGVLAGLLALQAISSDLAAADVVGDYAEGLAQSTLRALSSDGWRTAVGDARTGLTLGLSGIGMVLMAAAAWTDGSSCRAAADAAFAAERPYYLPGSGWSALNTHGWTNDAQLLASWCGGAAGIGFARLVGYQLSSELLLLAELGAAIEIIRRHLGELDTSLCHGVTGKLELMVAAGELLGEPSHIQAARRVASSVIERSQKVGGYQSGFGPDAADPSLLNGLCGTATLLLRLSDHRLLPNLALPPFLLGAPSPGTCQRL